MNRLPGWGIAGLLLVCLGGPAAASEDIVVMGREEGAASPPATIEDVAWLAGRWAGEGLGGAAEDLISPAAGGQMMGMFRHLKADGSVGFYEFYVFAEQGGSLTQRLKHFSLPLSGWEEKDEFVEFPLVKLEPGAAYFDGLTYLLGEDGALTVGVRVEVDQVAVFRYRKVD